MPEESPLLEAQKKFIDALPLRSIASETVPLAEAVGRILYEDLSSPENSPPYPRVIVEGFLVHTAATEGASEDSPVTFNIAGEIKPGDSACPDFKPDEALQVATGSVVSDQPLSVVRMWEAQVEGNQVSITRPFPPRFFIEELGCDIQQGNTLLEAGCRLTAIDIGNIASLGIDQVKVANQIRVAVFSSGDEVIPYTETVKPGAIRDSNSVMLSAAIAEAGGLASFAGIMKDDFDNFVNVLRTSLNEADMVVISGGTAVGGRDFISDLVSTVGELIIDGVPMRSGRPLIMGVAKGKPIVCVAGHPPEALRGFRLFGMAAFNKITGRVIEPPEDT